MNTKIRAGCAYLLVWTGDRGCWNGISQACSRQLDSTLEVSHLMNQRCNRKCLHWLLVFLVRLVGDELVLG